MASIDFYYTPGSAPCRSVLMTAKLLGVNLNLKLTNLHAGEHMTPEFIKMNPQHCVPTMNDGGFCLWESRAIIAYLVEKYGKDDSLYPKDPKARAVVNQRMFFDAGVLYQRFGDAYYPHMFGGGPLDAEKIKKMEEGLEFLNIFLEGQSFVAGPKMTIADVTILASVSTLQAVGVDIGKYKNVDKWLKSVQGMIPSYEETNGKGVEAFKQLFLSMTKK